MFRRREGRGSDSNNETRIVQNLTNNPITLGDLDNVEILPGSTYDLLKSASIQRIGNSTDLKLAVELGLLRFKNRRRENIDTSDIYDNIIPAVLADTRVAEEAERATELVRNTKTVSSDYTAVLDDDVILVDASAGEVTITLPSAIGINGYCFNIKRISDGSNNVIVAAPSEESIDGEDSQAITQQYMSFPIISNGSGWHIL